MHTVHRIIYIIMTYEQLYMYTDMWLNIIILYVLPIILHAIDIHLQGTHVCMQTCLPTYTNALMYA